MLYEHVNSEGKVDERVRPVDGSPNAAHLAAKAADDKSGWRAVDEAAPASTPKPKSAKSGDDAPRGVLS